MTYRSDGSQERTCILHLADMLSRSYLPHTGESDEFPQVNMVDYVTIGTERLNRIKTNTETDEALQMLKKVIQQGWPEDKHVLPNQVLPYFNIRDELSLQDGIIFRGERIVVPTNMRKEMKETLHSSHLGIESTLRHARDCLFWPGMTSEINQHMSSCDACRTYETQTRKKVSCLKTFHRDHGRKQHLISSPGKENTTLSQ